MKIQRIVTQSPFEEIRSLLNDEFSEDNTFRDQVAEIVGEVRQNGDKALVDYTARFDRFKVQGIGDLRIDAVTLAEAAERIDPELLAALRRAADNIHAFHLRQLETGFLDRTEDGSILGQRVTALARVGVYVPGGLAAYPSSVLMNVLPARVAGVGSIVMCSPTPDDEINDVVLAAAHIAGVTEVYRIGGAQAVAAMAYGTDAIQPVDKIVGPGNRWVAEAKRQVFGRVDIDMVAGPSEILVIADDTADARHVAADLIGQSEHDEDAIAWLVTTSSSLADEVPAALETLLESNPRAKIARKSLEDNGAIVVVPDLGAASDVANLRAPEHLELLVAEPMELLDDIRNAGAIFVGGYSPEPVGDYYAGPNHVLPTGGTARWASPLGTYDFLKRTSVISYSAERFASHAPDVIRLAESEGLHGHAEAVRIRYQDLQQADGTE